jgi:hypothetical protein
MSRPEQMHLDVLMSLCFEIQDGLTGLILAEIVAQIKT